MQSYDGGFLVKFGDKEEVRCASIELEYDGWRYKTNSRDYAPIPKNIDTITIVVENE